MTITMPKQLTYITTKLHKQYQKEENNFSKCLKKNSGKLIFLSQSHVPCLIQIFELGGGFGGGGGPIDFIVRQSLFI